jgi:hypothetical protein
MVASLSSRGKTREGKRGPARRMMKEAVEGGGGSRPVLGDMCRRWGSRASNGVAEVGAVEQHARQGSRVRKGVRTCGPLWAG